MSARCKMPEGRLAEWASGELSETDDVRVALHLGECPECQERVDDYRTLTDALGRLGDSDAMKWHRFGTPFGPMFVAASDQGVSRVSWQTRSPEAFERLIASRLPGFPVIEDREALAPVERQIVEYFAGERHDFDLPVDLVLAASPFQRAVLDAAREIPFGHVVSYGDLAETIDRPRASRAVGNALGANPVAIVVPCHRIVRGDGSLGGYGGGTAKKRHLLALEGVVTGG